MDSYFLWSILLSNLSWNFDLTSGNLFFEKYFFENIFQKYFVKNIFPEENSKFQDKSNNKIDHNKYESIEKISKFHV